MADHSVYEKLGLLYVGRELALGDGQPADLPLLYKSKYLTTHGVIIGMTGSGKTGLGIGLIEEAIMDDIPSLIIDPKGDMANLLLCFPELRPADFRPWLDPAEASRKQVSLDELALQTARNWQEGLAAWGQDGERIRVLRDKGRVTVYTPGSSSGVGISIVAGFSAPDRDTLADRDSLNDLVSSTVTSLLALVDIESDPLTSREHILISSILLHHWRLGEDLSLESLIGAIVDPPFAKVGVFDLSAFFPQSERMKLAMALNNVIASPSFASWLTGRPLDIQQLLFTADGRPRTALCSIAHLSEPERMFFVTLLLNGLISWMRRQQGTSSLRALLYMDEIFGYFPPTANPPSKKPMLLLLKQARAFGVGVVLSTQNPVDLDYKGLANIGTWFVGRLQTTQDQDRVLDGIVGAAGGRLDRSAVRTMLSGLQGRQFLLSSAHLDMPVLFESRWVMSFLKGPIGLREIAGLMEEQKRNAGDTEAVLQPERPIDAKLQDAAPLLSEGIVQRYYLEPVLADTVVFEPWLAACGSVRFYNSSRNIDEVRGCRLRIYLDETSDTPDWKGSEPLDIDIDACVDTPPKPSSYHRLPAGFSSLRDLRRLEKDFADFLYQHERLELLRAPALKLESRPGETEAEFAIRIADRLRELREEEAETLLKGMQRRREQLQRRLHGARIKIDKEKSDVSAKTADTLLSFGTAVLGAFLGRKAVSSTTMTRTASSIRKAGRIGKERDDVQRAEEEAARIEEDLGTLAAEQSAALEDLARRYDPSRVETERFAVKPRRGDIFDLDLFLLWVMVPPRPAAAPR